MQTIILKILTGVHLGARIELTSGTWTIGRDESCDIILAEKNVASRHAALTLTDSGQVSAQPLDDFVAKLSDPKTAVSTLQEGELYTFADVVFALGRTEADAAFWQKVSEDFFATMKPEAPVAPEASPEKTPEPAEVNAPKAKPTEPTVQTAPEEAPKTEEKASKKSLTPFIVAFTLALVVGAGALVLHRGPTLPSTSAIEQDLSKLVAEAGFTSVHVKYDKKGVVLITGSVKNDTERGHLVEISRMLKTPVALDVTVDEDYTRPLKEAFNTLDFWPSVVLTKGKGGAMSLTVAGYMLSNVVEEEAFVKAVANVPELATPSPMNPIKVNRKIVHRAELERLATKVFTEKGVTGAQLDFLPGRIVVNTVHTPEGHQRLDAALKRLETLAGVPLNIKTVNLAAGSTLPRQQRSVGLEKMLEKASPVTQSDPMKPRFKVVSVSGGALKFVTLSNGSKYFAGGRMPGGFTLESVSYDRLILSKDKKRIIYPLRVNK